MIKKILTTTLFASIIVIIIIMVAILVAGVYRFNFPNGGDVLPVVNATDVKNASYTIDGEVFTLVQGKAENLIAPNSATKHTVSIFGEPVYGDLTADGKNDAAVLLVSNPGGSGTFYYAVLAIATGTTYVTTNTLLLGDRIAPQTVEIRDGRAVYNYAERKAGEPMTTAPSIGKSFWVQYDASTGQIGQFVQDFEGDADPKAMTLGMKKWTWTKTLMNDGKVITPKKSDVFRVTFTSDGKVSVATDCNSMGGSYTTKDTSLTFGPMISTRMYCEGSQEDEFAKMLSEVGSYMFTKKGELVLMLKYDSGSMIFK